MILAELIKRWDREFTGNTFWFEYMDFEGFVSQDWSHYQSQTEQLTLSDTDSTMITVTRSDYDPGMFLNISYTSTASGDFLTCTGQYLELWNSGGSEVTVEVGDPFAIPCDGTAFGINTSMMRWKDPYATESVGKALRITFGVDDSGITETQDGTYTFDVRVSMGPDE